MSGQGSGRPVDDGGRRERSRRLSAVTSPQPEGEGATVRAAPLRESCCLDTLLKPKGEEAEPHMRRAKATDRAKNPESSAGLLRGMGSGTGGRSAAEQERPYRVALEWADRAYKAEPKAPGARRESEGVIVPRTARKVEPRAGKDPCLGRAFGGGKDEGLAQAQSPRRKAVSEEETLSKGTPTGPVRVLR